MTEETRSARGFAQLHADCWRCMLMYPGYFILLPIILYFPFDFLAEYLSIDSSRSVWQNLRIYYRISQISELIAGTYLFGVHLEIIRRMAKGEEIDNSVLTTGLSYFWTLLRAAVLVGVRIMLFLLLLIVPGIIKGIRLSLVGPLLIIGGVGVNVTAAIHRSEEMMKGRSGRFFGYLCLSLLIYMSGFIGFTLFFPDDNALVNTIVGVPYNLLVPLWTLGISLFFVDLTSETAFRRPIGPPDPRNPTYDPVADLPSRKSVVIASVTAAALLVSGLIYSAMQPPFPGTLAHTFGPQEHELYYEKTISQMEVVSVAAACQRTEMFNQQDPWYFLLETTALGYRLNILVPQKYWNESGIAETAAELKAQLAQETLERPIEVALYDDYNEKRLTVNASIAAPLLPDPLLDEEGTEKVWH